MQDKKMGVRDQFGKFWWCWIYAAPSTGFSHFASNYRRQSVFFLISRSQFNVLWPKEKAIHNGFVLDSLPVMSHFRHDIARWGTEFSSSGELGNGPSSNIIQSIRVTDSSHKLQCIHYDIHASRQSGWVTPKLTGTDRIFWVDFLKIEYNNKYYAVKVSPGGSYWALVLAPGS